MCQQFVCIVIANLKLVGHIMTCKTVSLDIYAVDIISLGNCSDGIISIDYIKSKDNLADPLTKGLTREQVNCTSRGIRLKPMTKESP